MAFKLLIVDDSELIRLSLRRLLDTVPNITGMTAVATLDQALSSILAAQPSLIILDLQLPGSQGTRALSTLKQFSPPSLLAVLTNDASTFTHTLCKLAGADWVFDKATQFQGLLDRVRTQAALN